MKKEDQYPRFYQPNANYLSDEFFGRENDIQDVIHFIQNGQNVCLIGLRRIGRTWFLNHLVNQASQVSTIGENLLIPSKLDVSVLGNFAPNEATRKILSVIQEAMADLEWIGNTKAKFGNNEWDGFYDAFEFFAPILENHNKRLVLLLDEAEALARIYRPDKNESNQASLASNSQFKN